MELPGDFTKFLEEIRPTANMREDCKRGHTTLRERLNTYTDLQSIVVADFLQGSYRRSTVVRPKNGKRLDVDIVVVTTLSEGEYTPKKAMAVLEPFLQYYYKGKWKAQGRSFGIELTYIDMDLVITSAPFEAEIGIFNSDAVKSDDELMEAIDWRLNPSWLSLRSRGQKFNVKSILERAAQQAEWELQPLRIPDRDVGLWEDTHPLEQIRWTRDKNKITNGFFVSVVKCIKWWWLEQFDEPRSPKSFPLERLVGECCPNNVTSIADGLVKTLETIVSSYGIYITTNSKPILPDYGVPSHDVFRRVTAGDFAKFYSCVQSDAVLARRAFDSKEREESGNLWRTLLGDKFPESPNGGGSKSSGYTPPTKPAIPGSSRFA